MDRVRSGNHSPRRHYVPYYIGNLFGHARFNRSNGPENSSYDPRRFFRADGKRNGTGSTASTGVFEERNSTSSAASADSCKERNGASSAASADGCKERDGASSAASADVDSKERNGTSSAASAESSNGLVSNSTQDKIRVRPGR
jgi:hypothetical protein